MKKSAREGFPIYWEAWNSPFGMITVCCSEKGLREIAMGPSWKVRTGNGSPPVMRHKRSSLPRADEGLAPPRWIRAGNREGRGAAIARRALSELREYAAGRRKRFTVPLDLRGTDFQLKVWKALRSIPYGETRSYLQVARAVGNTRAARAVGMANHWNPVPIIVPCHRVVASDGSLGGYASGLQIKARMLRLEKANA